LKRISSLEDIKKKWKWIKKPELGEEDMATMDTNIANDEALKTFWTDFS